MGSEAEGEGEEEEDCIPDLLSTRDRKEIEKVEDHKDLHCSVHHMKGSVVGVVIEIHAMLLLSQCSKHCGDGKHVVGGRQTGGQFCLQVF